MEITSATLQRGAFNFIAPIKLRCFIAGNLRSAINIMPTSLFFALAVKLIFGIGLVGCGTESIEQEVTPSPTEAPTQSPKEPDLQNLLSSRDQ